VSAAARRILLHEVIIPYDRTLGQKKRHDTTAEFAVRARGQFLRWVHSVADLEDTRSIASGWVFERLLEIVEDGRAFNREAWGNGRFVWLPYQWALTPEQHDTQPEIDRLVEATVQEQFKDGNRVWYIINERFHLEQARMILEAEDYHVLWIHDIRGNDGEGEPDEMGYHLTRTYLEALNQAVARYEDTGKIPMYLVLLDQWYYEITNGRRWLGLLEAPLDRSVDLPDGYEAWEAEIEALQARLREGVEGSLLLQAETRQYGEDWLKNLIKVHVNITNPSDPTFWSPEVLPLVGMPDNVMRDHRKIAFFDISEEDPYRGRAIYTGAGIGEHYAGSTWEDRAILAEGPAFLTLKDAARQVLLNQGFLPDQIPWELQPKEKPGDYDQRVREAQRGARIRDNVRAMELHNQTGFNPKPINAAKAALYTLMPAGSVVKAPDSLWSGHIWGSLLMGASLRGVRVLVIAPSIESAPSPGFPAMSRAHELFERMILFAELFEGPLEDAGGMLRLGMYDPDVPVADIPGRTRLFVETLEREPWLRDLYGFEPAVFDELHAILRSFEEERFSQRYLLDRPAPDSVAPDSVAPAAQRPKLHMKAHFFASRFGWEQILSLPGWGEILTTYQRERARQVSDPTGGDYFEFADSMSAVTGPRLRTFVAARTAEQFDRMVFYFMTGAHNQNYRSMILDGEVMVVLAEMGALVGLIDMMWIVGQSKWITDQESLDEHLPEYSGFKRRMGRWLRLIV
jgi:hypothetical protein